MKILVCEDDDVVVKLVEVALSNENVALTITRHGQDAIDLLEGGQVFDLILTDLHMPHRNGDDILHVVRQDLKLTTPIIMLSSDGEEEVIDLALRLGTNDFIVKPLTVDKILKKVKKYLV